jgi:methionyl-tRNA synthetase
MTDKKFITTTLPYTNSVPHIGHCFEFVIADTLAEYYRKALGRQNVLLNVGVDEHGQKIAQKAHEEGYSNTQEYCNVLAEKWKEFCQKLSIDYDNFYRTTDPSHHVFVKRFFSEILQHTFTKEYTGEYCVGCEAFKTQKEIVYGKCAIHGINLQKISESNVFFDLGKFLPRVKDVLIDPELSSELKNILKESFDLSITRKNVKWGIPTEEGDVFYVWFDALLNYLAAAKFYENSSEFESWWKDSLQVCGKDNLKFQAAIFQGLLLSHDIPQTKEILVHGMILDEHGKKMSKSLGNVIDPLVQLEKYGLDPLRFYLSGGLETFRDCNYSENDLINLWNSEVVNGIGNLISRTLHLIDTKGIDISRKIDEDLWETLELIHTVLQEHFESGNLKKARESLYSWVNWGNSEIQNKRPFAKDAIDPEKTLFDLYWVTKTLASYYEIFLKGHSEKLREAFLVNKKAVIFQRIDKNLLLLTQQP